MLRTRRRANSLRGEKGSVRSSGSAEDKEKSSRRKSLGDAYAGMKGELKRRISLKRNTADEGDAEKSWKDSRRFIFIIGAVLGLMLALWAGSSGDKYKNELFDNFFAFESVQNYVGDWKELLPSSVSGLIEDFQFDNNQADLTESFAVGKQLRNDLGLSDKHPLVIVPGVISTGIESWGLYKDDECDSEPHFRKRLWGSFYMLKTMVLDKNCWLKHVKLDPETGLDPPHYKLRAAQGFEAADFFMAGYWLWNKVLQNLGAIGYETNKMAAAAYDWRLSYLDLEVRDRYFSKLKMQIELQLESTGEKSVIVGHSMGSQVVFYFLKWVEASGERYGNGGDGWVDKHIAAFVDVAGTLLGAPKCVPALISGEMKDTIQLNTIAMYGLEKFFSRRERLEMIQTWGGIPSMLPKGGDLIWGNLNFSVEDTVSHRNNSDTYGNFIRFADANEEIIEEDDATLTNFTMSSAIQYVQDTSPIWLKERIEDQYSFGYATTEEEMKENELHHSHWSNPMEVPLPNAPNMKIYCLYGTDNPTERAYTYKKDHKASFLNMTIAFDSPQPVFFTDGDGTVPLITHAMCHKWKEGVSAYNPAGIEVKIVEMKHQPDRFDIRGGAKSAEHVDILGSAELNEYILKIAAGEGDTIEERILSDLPQWVDQIPFPL
ncbi:unnamed protein product [Kluyveromyces dobzhanskii CBS 2104]|uniref:WGS project CCBQ000000000 data, contig 00015 n=1 Tax=Kluyveromyces dobzhanskii CBS 2104 TaxID=1427455 RepID=A0A0A8L9M1_9SACH|nr:unnamed protein product [Kluyveromyces dobzhanskii CBS 2104]